MTLNLNDNNNPSNADVDVDVDVDVETAESESHHQGDGDGDAPCPSTSNGNGRRGWKSIGFVIFGTTILGAGVIVFSKGLVSIKNYNSKLISAKNGAIDTPNTPMLEAVTGTAKASKMSKKKEEEVVVECGATIHGKRVVLDRNLACNATAVDGVLNAALTLDGPDAELICVNGANITQVGVDVPWDRYFQDCFLGALRELPSGEFEGNLETDPTKVEEIKNSCNLSYMYGLKLLNGAKLFGCVIETFVVGVYAGQGAEEVKDVTASNNFYGVLAETNEKMKITNV